ncbi:MAG TPA: hypothetical protein DC023_04715 [Oceanospirillaceae bacterium]|nr:hypothetical protein [Oceanospirillaceae bacterium]
MLPTSIQFQLFKTTIFHLKQVLVILSLGALLSACALGPVASPAVEERSLDTYPQPVKAGPPLTSSPMVDKIATPSATDLSNLSVDKFNSAGAQAPTLTPRTPVATPSLSLSLASQEVVEQLVLQADTAKANNELEIAVIKLQQAQRIAPQEPKVYARLAALYLADGQAVRAEQLARKGLSLVANQPTYGDFFWRLIAASRRYQGDIEGEQAALSRAAQLAQ